MVHSHVSLDFSAITRHFSLSLRYRPATIMSSTYCSTESCTPSRFCTLELHTAKSPAASAELPPTRAVFSMTLTSAPAFFASSAAARPVYPLPTTRTSHSSSHFVSAPLVAADAVCLSCGAHPAKPNVASTPAAAAPVMNERRDTPVSLIPITASSNDGFTCSMRRRGASRETTLRTQTGARTPPEAGNCETPLEVGCSIRGYRRGIVKANFRMSLL